MQNYDYYIDPECFSMESDIILHNVGFAICTSNFSAGYFKRDYYLIHYVVNGKGTYTINDKTYHLTKNEGFLIPPDTNIMHRADAKDPWTVYWIGFSGKIAKKYLEAAKLDYSNLIFEYSKDDFIKECIENLYNKTRNPYCLPSSMLGYFYLLIGALIEENGFQNNAIVPLNHFEKTIRYVSRNIRTNIKVSDIAQHVGIDPSQLYRVIKKKCGISLQQFVTKLKMEKAIELITKTDLSYREISFCLGFEYESHFYKVFKKYFHMTPSEFRKTSDLTNNSQLQEPNKIS